MGWTFGIYQLVFVAEAKNQTAGNRYFVSSMIYSHFLEALVGAALLLPGSVLPTILGGLLREYFVLTLCAWQNLHSENSASKFGAIL
jgi:hypothetical protein